MTPRMRARLTINLKALKANWQKLNQLSGPAECAGVIKADAYGVGALPVAKALGQAGCTTFFVANIDEGLALRGQHPNAKIAILNGLTAEPKDYSAAGLRPVLSSLSQVKSWGQTTGGAPAFIQLDTGMARLGLDGDESEELVEDPGLIQGWQDLILLSHLASAEEPDNLENDLQLEQVSQVKRHLKLPVSFANSSGIFLGQDYHFEQTRPGYALYGGNPTPNAANPMQRVIGLEAPILQLRDIGKGQRVGYNGTWKAAAPARLATLPIGYADGFMRLQSNQAKLYWQGQPVSVVGRVSMDLITVDVTGLNVQIGDVLQVLGPDQDLESLAHTANTIGYELLAALGSRYERVYL